MPSAGSMVLDRSGQRWECRTLQVCATASGNPPLCGGTSSCRGRGPHGRHRSSAGRAPGGARGDDWTRPRLRHRHDDRRRARQRRRSVLHRRRTPGRLGGRGRRALLWVFVLAMVTVSTAFMSLDTTAVLITPVIVVLARHVGLSPLPFALATVWLANTASLFLPVSNLTNLLAADALDGTPLEFFAEFWAPALVAVLITVLALTL